MEIQSKKIAAGMSVNRALIPVILCFAVMIVLTAAGFLMSDHKMRDVFSCVVIIAGTLAFRLVPKSTQSLVAGIENHGKQK